MPFSNPDPMRGVISTDTFPAVPVARQLQTVGGFRVPTDAAAWRVVPVPRELLRSCFRSAGL